MPRIPWGERTELIRAKARLSYRARRTPSNTRQKRQRLPARAPVFANSCLPLTADLAECLIRFVQPELVDSPHDWSLTDRVLVWLLPSLRQDVKAFHRLNGPAMQDIFAAQALESIDSALLRLMLEKLEVVRPGLIAEIVSTVERAAARRSRKPRRRSRNA
jgi:hypothetical protein